MVLSKEHNKQMPVDFEYYAKWKLAEVGKGIFSYRDKFVLLQDKFSTIPSHWHMCASDLDPASEDYELILETPFEVIKTHD